MGLFSFLKDAAIEANEEAHGVRLLTGVQSSFEVMERLEEQVQFRALAGFLQIRERLMNEIPNFSREGQIQLGRKMQDQAKSAFNLDMSGSYAKWLAGAWLESKERNSLKAQQAFGLLEGLAEHINKTINQRMAATEEARASQEAQAEARKAKLGRIVAMQKAARELLARRGAKQPPAAPPGQTLGKKDTMHYTNFDEWYLAYKKAAAKQNKQLTLDANNGSMIDFMEHEPLRRAFRDGISPEQLGRNFASQYDFSTFGR